MARFLVRSTRSRLHLVVTLLAVTLIMATNVIPVYAGHYYGWFTAYAMGNRYGGAGVEIRQGHFANHYYNWCPSDPAALVAVGDAHCYRQLYPPTQPVRRNRQLLHLLPGGHR